MTKDNANPVKALDVYVPEWVREAYLQLTVEEKAAAFDALLEEACGAYSYYHRKGMKPTRCPDFNPYICKRILFESARVVINYRHQQGKPDLSK